MLKQDKDKYSHYEYTTYCDSDYGDTWCYVIHMNDWVYGDDIESDEYYDTRDCAIEAAQGHIDRLEDGPSEPDYNTPNYFEQAPNYWQERFKLGE